VFEESGGYVEIPVYRREALLAGNVLDGPAIIEQLDATTVIYPRQRAHVDRLGNLVVTVETGTGAR
jgi:N-methylhydantoinase A